MIAGRAVEQLQDPLIAIQLAQRCDGVVGKHAIGFFQNLFKVRIRNATGDERAHHPEGQFVVRQAGPRSDFFLGEAWQVLRHVQAAVSGKACQQNVFEIQGRCLAAGADITHDWLL